MKNEEIWRGESKERKLKKEKKREREREKEPLVQAGMT